MRQRAFSSCVHAVAQWEEQVEADNQVGMVAKESADLLHDTYHGTPAIMQIIRVSRSLNAVIERMRVLRLPSTAKFAQNGKEFVIP